MAVLQALGAEPEDSAKSNTTQSSGVCESPVQEEVGSECGDPFLLPLPRARAATVIPEDRLDSSASVAITVPAAVPHPPPLLHILPPTPELQRARRNPNPNPPHRPEELSLSLAEQSSSEEMSPLTLGSTNSDIVDESLSDLTNDRSSPSSPSPLGLPFAPSDDNNNPSDLHIGSAFDSRDEATLSSSSHSADSIDFFSAREKFLGLTQDGGIQSPLEPTQQKSPLSNEETEEDHQGKESQVNLIHLLQQHWHNCAAQSTPLPPSSCFVLDSNIKYNILQDWKQDL